MKRLIITTIVSVLGLFTCICVADQCMCWRRHEFGGCHIYDCVPDGDPNDPDTTWRKGSNSLPAWCENVNDPNLYCSETYVSLYCASGKVYWDEDCTDFKTFFVVTYKGWWATSRSHKCLD
ncbi:MAG: hypothetical protein ACE5NM_01340 [Sedimentisphaerales bacterium]